MAAAAVELKVVAVMTRYKDWHSISVQSLTEAMLNNLVSPFEQRYLRIFLHSTNLA